MCIPSDVLRSIELFQNPLTCLFEIFYKVISLHLWPKNTLRDNDKYHIWRPREPLGAGLWYFTQSIRMHLCCFWTLLGDAQSCKDRGAAGVSVLTHKGVFFSAFHFCTCVSFWKGCLTACWCADCWGQQCLWR